MLWQRPRLITPGQSDLPLRDIRQFAAVMTERRKRIFSGTAKALAAGCNAYVPKPYSPRELLKKIREFVPA